MTGQPEQAQIDKTLTHAFSKAFGDGRAQEEINEARRNLATLAARLRQAEGSLEDCRKHLGKTAREWHADFVRRGVEVDALAARLRQTEEENSYLRQFSNPGEIAALAEQIDAEQVTRADAAEEHIRQAEQVIEAARPVSHEWHWPDEEPPSETYFHDLVMAMDDALAAYDAAKEQP